jgi:parallel beta-helix repeat protein
MMKSYRKTKSSVNEVNIEVLAAMSFIILVVLFSLFNVVSTAKSATLYVPSDYDTIQAAIDASSDDDEVVVADGTYTGNGNKNLNLLGKSITVRSENGPENCIIDCEQDGKGFFVNHGEGSDSVIQGFSIKNGFAVGTFPDNNGGGILCYSASPTIIDCIFINNVAQSWGGAIWCFYSTPLITDCTFIENTAELGAGGVGFYFSDATITNSLFVGGSTIWGGGICTHTASPTITNNIILKNSASVGGGIYCWDSSFPNIINNTIVSNSAIENGSGIACGRSSSPIAVNTILWDKKNEVYLDNSSITIMYSDVKGGYEGEGNIDAVPQFLSLRNNDYHLRPTSPCIGAGANVGAPSFDKDGNKRPNPPGSNCDIGAYESRLGQPKGAQLAPKMIKKLASTWGKIKREP